MGVIKAQYIPPDNNYQDVIHFETDSDVVVCKDGKTLEEKIGENELSSFASSKDENGIFTVVEYKRSDSTLYLKSTLSNPDAVGLYQDVTVEYFDDTGLVVTETINWRLTYDVEGSIVSKSKVVVI